MQLTLEQWYHDWNFSAGKHKQSQFNLKFSNNISLLLLIKLLK